MLKVVIMYFFLISIWKCIDRYRKEMEYFLSVVKVNKWEIDVDL